MRNRLTIICALLAAAIIGFLSPVAVQTSRADARDEALLAGLLPLAEKGDAEAQYHVGMLYNNGIGTSADPKKAFGWFEKATKSGDPLGAFKLGCYYDGQFPGVVPVDPALGLKYKLVAAEQGYDLAQLGVAKHYQSSKNIPEAVRWWSAAAKQGETDSMHYLAESYAQGQVVPMDLPLSYHYLDALNRLPEFSSDQWVDQALAYVTGEMTADQLAAAKGTAPLVIEPSALTLKARDGVYQAEKHLAASTK